MRPLGERMRDSRPERGEDRVVGELRRPDEDVVEDEAEQPHRELDVGVPAQRLAQRGGPAARRECAGRHPAEEDHEHEHLRVRAVADEQPEVAHPDGLVDEPSGAGQHEDRAEEEQHASQTDAGALRHARTACATAVYTHSPLAYISSLVRRDGREAEGTGLLNRHRGSTPIEGSNPSLSVPTGPAADVAGLSCFHLCSLRRVVHVRSRSTTSTPLRSVAHTGYLHVGGARTALFNWLLRPASTAAQFLLRIEDTDKARSTDESTRAIFEGLEWLGLVVGRGSRLPGREPRAPPGATRCACSTPAQRIAASARRRSSTSGARTPRRASEAFKYDRRCDRLPPDEIDAPRRRGRCRSSIRFRMPEGTTAWNDLVHERDRVPEQGHRGLHRPPLRRHADLQPGRRVRRHRDAHHARHARRRSHLEHAEADPALPRARRRRCRVFAHLPMIHGMDGKKLSKRHGATAVGDYQHQGILPGGDAQLPRAARLVARRRHRGDDAAGDDRAVLDATGCRRRRRSSIPKKLEWMNGQHLSLHPARRSSSRS